MLLLIILSLALPQTYQPIKLGFSQLIGNSPMYAKLTINYKVINISISVDSFASLTPFNQTPCDDNCISNIFIRHHKAYHLF